MKSVLLYLCLLFLSFDSIAQENDDLRFTQENSIQVELGGNAAFYSFIYERILINGNRFKTSGQAGIAYYPPSAGILDLWIPVLVNELYSFNKQNHLELGIGYAFVYAASRDYENNPYNWEWSGFYTGRLGYRYTFKNDKCFLRVAFTPFVEYYAKGNMDFIPSGGAAFAFSF